MLVLSRKLTEKLKLKLPDGQIITLSVLGLRTNKVMIGIDAPDSVIVDREEIFSAKIADKLAGRVHIKA